MKNVIIWNLYAVGMRHFLVYFSPVYFCALDDTNKFDANAFDVFSQESLIGKSAYLCRENPAQIKRLFVYRSIYKIRKHINIKSKTKSDINNLETGWQVTMSLDSSKKFQLKDSTYIFYGFYWVYGRLRIMEGISDHSTVILAQKRPNPDKIEQMWKLVIMTDQCM